jgi:5'-methylthioinosine phosphorylase
LFDGRDRQVEHIDFTYPYCPKLRDRLIAAGSALGMALEPRGVYGATQGPRLETAAEIARMAKDGCSIVGMTGMPEAALAREAGLNYANCSLVVNWAAGTRNEVISLDDIKRQLDTGMGDIRSLILEFLREE